MATPSGVSSSGLNFTGLATGIDTAKIIAGLTRIGQARIDGLTARQSDLVSKQTTFAALQGQLFNLRSAAGQMARAAGGAFDGRAAASSDATALTVAAGTAATTGTYTVGVGALAQAHQVASQGFADPTAALKTGTVTLQVGTGAATTVTLDARNATLQGLADAINTATGEVRAAVINDGSATPYRLLLTSTKTGAANAIQVTAALTGGTGADLDPAAKTVQAAADASVTLGTGPGALTVTSGTNQLAGLIPGVTLNLLRADPAKPLTVTVANDTEAAGKAVQNFVDAFNAVRGFIADRSGYDATTKQAGELLGNRDVAALADDLAASVSSTIPGLNPAANRLSSVGLSFDDKGKLQLNSATLGRALSGESGVPIADVKRLFALSGTSDNPGVAFAYGSDKTKATGVSPVKVEVTAPATRATVIASGPPATSVTVIPANATLQMKLNGLVASGVSLDAGTYTTDELAAMLQRRINADPGLNGNALTVGVDGGGRLQFTSQMHGSGASVAVTGGSALAALGFAGTESGAGTDVAGRFVVNGVAEAATGTGLVLTGAAGNATTDGLQVRSTLTVPGDANVTVRQGLASRLAQTLDRYLDPKVGRLKSVDAAFQSGVDDITKTITKQKALLDAKTAQLQTQFAAMESAVNNLKGLQSQLTALLPTTR